MHRISLDAEFVTPAFIGGSEPEHARLSAAGIRGQLRWWFRAIAGGRTAGDLDETRRLEQLAFGSTERRSALRIVLTKTPEPTRDAIRSSALRAEDIIAISRTPGGAAAANRVQVTTRPNGGETLTNTLAYLGYGAMTFRGDPTREYFPPPSPWSMFIQARELDPEAKPLVDEALWAWICLGSLGTRSRRGFGSVRCTGIAGTGDNMRLLDAGIDAFRKDARGFLERNVSTSSPATWSYFTAASSIFISTEGFDSWQIALTRAGAWMVAFRRRYGVATDERTGLGGRDYTWLKQAGAPAGVPDRAGFGLPLPFGRTEDQVVAWGQGGRRASPLLIRISNFGGRFYPVLTHLPAALIPDRERLHFRTRSSAETPQQISIVTDFLKQLASRKVITAV